MPSKLIRVCAVRGKTYKGKNREDTYGFKTVLKWLDHPNWEHDKAHRSCIAELQKKREG